ncbi:hypothetical protein [Rhizobium wuzhouense]|uniref:Uncharacterized protein n=1 Tax=Rhizobium wuzhouense TaxID=1986026 RepID=A0ABX5NTA4_9HYPH|nr:hypothetical protein [Rhizobium wuzhouense]PYB71681.1 hypothetical protein DMY87_15815 [Rhizobium wuzhouense]
MESEFRTQGNHQHDSAFNGRALVRDLGKGQLPMRLNRVVRSSIVHLFSRSVFPQDAARLEKAVTQMDYKGSVPGLFLNLGFLFC